MFAKSVIDSDAFLEMPLSTQALYFHLGMRADDDGFVNSPKRIARMIGASDDEFKILLAKKFVLSFETGVIVLKHWKLHNYIPKDRYHETKYKNEKATLSLDENNSYTNNPKTPAITIVSEPCMQTVYEPVYNLSTEVRLGKDSIGKYNIDNMSGEPDSDTQEIQKKPKKPKQEKKPKDYSIEGELLDYLNEKAVKKHEHTQNNYKYISARLNEISLKTGKNIFTIDKLKNVIDYKVKEWKDDTKMRQYLRPETIFGSKCAGYLEEYKKSIGQSSSGDSKKCYNL